MQCNKVIHWKHSILLLCYTIQNIRDNYKFFLRDRYVDDEIVVGHSEKVVETLDNIREMGPELGLELNINKTKTF
jgi:hypothetical protein